MFKPLLVSVTLGAAIGIFPASPPISILIVLVLAGWLFNELKKNRDEIYRFLREFWPELRQYLPELRQFLPLLIFDFAIGAVVWFLDLVTGTNIASIIYLIIYIAVPVAFFAIFMARLLLQRHQRRF